MSVGDEKPVKLPAAKATPARTLASAEATRKKKKWRSGFDTWTPEWTKWCDETYNSFDPKTGYYNAFSGEKKFCK